jgi:hypothetical protein
MLLIEHLLLVSVILVVLFLIFFGSAIFAQLLDFDHTCGTCSVSERISLLLTCGKASDMNGFSGECFRLHRGIFHSVKLFYFEVLLLVCIAGLVFGHGVHLAADGYDVFSVFRLVWLRDVLKGILGL